jgi:hypothetical protein
VFSIIRVPLATGALALGLLVAPNVHAQQVVSPDFANSVQPTLPSNQQLVGQIQDTLPSTDLSAITDQANASASTGQELVDALNSALPLAPDDASHTRLQAVLTHTQAAMASLHMVQSETSLDAARGRLDAALGEAQEGLDELQPFVLSLVSSGAITGK